MWRIGVINMGRHRLMHLPKPVGPYHVSFADFELRRTPGSAEQSEGDAGVEDVEKSALGAEGAPVMRFFYPTAAEPKWSPPDTQTRRWLPHFNYTWGYFSKIIIPSSFLRRFIIWALSCMYVSLSFKNICCLSLPIGNHTCSYVEVLQASISEHSGFLRLIIIIWALSCMFVSQTVFYFHFLVAFLYLVHCRSPQSLTIILHSGFLVSITVVTSLNCRFSLND